VTIQKTKGNSGEEIAEKYLVAQGTAIIERQFHSKNGEIDLIADDQGTLLFIEVKHYKKNSLKNLYAAIPKSKQQKIIKTAQWYMLKTGLGNSPTRFDVILIEDGQIIEHIKGAFWGA
jgi:putative endonuclease